jgi:hypothetical protein
MLFASTIIAILLMFITYCIPNDRVDENVKESALLMASDGYFRKSVKNTTGADIDNFSLSFSLGISIFDGNYTILEKIMLNTSFEYGVPKYYDVLNTLNKVKTDEVSIYGRYWHGAAFFLKVLHLCFDLRDIRLINVVLQTLLLVVVLGFIYKRLGVFFALGYLFSVTFLQPLTMAYSIPYSPLYYLVLLSSFFVLWADKKNVNWKMFFILGCMVCFIDLLMFPLVVLCFPLFLVINLYGANLKNDIKKVVGYSVSWSVGYLGLWFNKFLLASLFTDENILKDGFDAIHHRLSGYKNPGVDWSFKWALERNLGEYLNEVNVWILCVFLVAVLICFVFGKYGIKKNYMVFVNLFIGLYPFIWCMIVRNHSIEHPGSVYRIFTVVIMALCFAIFCCIKNNNCKEIKKIGDEDIV